MCAACLEGTCTTHGPNAREIQIQVRVSPTSEYTHYDWVNEVCLAWVCLTDREKRRIKKMNWYLFEVLEGLTDAFGRRPLRLVRFVTYHRRPRYPPPSITRDERSHT